MGRTPCCMKEGLNRGPWTPDEDLRLSNYVETHGEGGWRTRPKKAGLLRCGKSCRLRWMNYLRPDVKRGKILPEEEDLILRLHRLLGNRWSLIAGRIPGRTDNEIKNYWNTHLSKKLITKGIDPRTHKPLSESQDVSAVSGDCDTNPKSPREENIPQSSQVPQNTVRIGAAKRESVGFTEKDDGGSPCTQSSYHIPETFPLSAALNFSEGDVSCHNDKAVPPPALVKSGVMGTPFLFEETFTDNEVSLPPFITTTSISGLAGLGLGDYHHHNYLLNNSSYDTRSSYSRGAVPFLNNDASVPSNASLEKQLQASQDLQAFEMELENSDTLHHNKLSNTNWASPVFSFSAFDDCSSAMLSSLTQSFLNEELQLHHSETSPHLNSVLEPFPNRNDSGSLLWSLLSPTEHYYPCT